MVLKVSWAPGGCWFPLNGRVLGTRGSRGTYKKNFKNCLKFLIKPHFFLLSVFITPGLSLYHSHSTGPISTMTHFRGSHMNFPCLDMGLEPRPPLPMCSAIRRSSY